MSIVSDLTGLGMAPTLAGYVGSQVIKSITGANAQGTGLVGTTGLLTGGISVLNTAGGAATYTLPVNAQAGKPYFVFNPNSTSGVVYTPTGGATLNGSTTGNITVAQNKGAVFMLVSGAGSNSAVWFSLLGS